MIAEALKRAALDAHFEREWPQVRARMDAA